MIEVDLNGIGKRIQDRRKQQGYTQEKIAEMMNVSIQMVSNLERGNKAIRIDNLINLSQILNISTDYILTGNSNYIEPRTYRKYFNKVLKEAKIKHFNFHSLRHTFATNCISLGVDYKTVSELLGHANVNITLNLYVHPRLSQKKKCIDLVCKVFQEKVI